MVEPILKELRNGNPNGDGFTVKEILTAHIRDNREAHELLLKQMEDVKLRYSTKRMVVGMFCFLSGWVAWLSVELWTFIKK